MTDTKTIKITINKETTKHYKELMKKALPTADFRRLVTITENELADTMRHFRMRAHGGWDLDFSSVIDAILAEYTNNVSINLEWYFMGLLSEKGLMLTTKEPKIKSKLFITKRRKKNGKKGNKNVRRTAKGTRKARKKNR